MIDLKNVAIQCECTDLKSVQGHYRDDVMQVEAMRAHMLFTGMIVRNVTTKIISITN